MPDDFGEAELPSACPGCGAPLDRPRCARCGVDLSRADAAELRAIDWELHRLTVQRSVVLHRLRTGAPIIAPPPPPSPFGPAPPPPAPFEPPSSSLPPLFAPGVSLHGLAGQPGRARPGTSLQNLLLTLGTGLLAVAAVVFTAVNWSHLGALVQGGTLLAITLAAGVGARAVGRRGMHSTAEALAAVTMLFAAVDAHALRVGLLPESDALTFWCFAIAALAIVAWAVGALTGTRGPRLVAVLVGQVPLPLFVVGRHVGTPGGPLACLAQTAVVALAIRAFESRTVTRAGGDSLTADQPGRKTFWRSWAWTGPAHLRQNESDGTRTAAVSGAVGTWSIVTLAAVGFFETASSLAARSVTLFGAAAVAALVTSLWREDDRVRPVALVAATVVGLSAVATALAGVVHGEAWWVSVAALSTAVLAVATRLPRPWAGAPAGVSGVALAISSVPAAATIARAAAASTNSLDAPWQRAAGVHTTQLIPTASVLPSGRSVAVHLALVCLAVLVTRRWVERLVPVSVIIGAAAVAALLVAPVAMGWTVATTVGVLLAAAALPLALAVGRPDLVSLGQGAGLSVVLVVVAGAWAAAAAPTTIGAVGAVVVLALATAVVAAWRNDGGSAVAAAVVTVSGAAAVPGLVLADRGAAVSSCWLAVAVAAAVVGLFGFVVDADGRGRASSSSPVTSSPERSVRGLLAVAVELTAGVAHVVALVVLAGETDVDPLMVGLAVGAAVAAAHATRPGRRWLAGWAALEALTLYWLRLATSGIRAPEAYSLPLAAVLLLGGWWIERRRPTDARPTSWASFGPGLLVATVPTVAYALGDPGLTRPLGALVAGITVLVGGAASHRRALVDVGTVTVVLLGLRQLAPVIGDLPRWLVLGVGGAVLLSVGATFEQRRNDVAGIRDRYSALH